MVKRFSAFLSTNNVLCLKKLVSHFTLMFVNTKGRIDTHIPVDLQMDYIVCVCKKHIQHMFSNKKKTQILSKRQDH